MHNELYYLKATAHLVSHNFPWLATEEGGHTVLIYYAINAIIMKQGHISFSVHVHSWFTMIQRFCRKWKQLVLEEGLCPLSVSFILALGHLQSFLLLDNLLPQLPPWETWFSKVLLGLLRGEDHSVTPSGLDRTVVPTYREPQNSHPILSGGWRGTAEAITDAVCWSASTSLSRIGRKPWSIINLMQNCLI